MQRWYHGAAIALGCLALGACAAQNDGPRPIGPAEAAIQLRTGAAAPHCRAQCVAEWRRRQPMAAQFEAGGGWSDLAALVINAGFEDDLSLYYLGRAAEGLGYPAAADKYYRHSVALSGSAASCRHLSGVCGGVALPRAASSRLAAIEHGERRHPSRRAHPAAEPPKPVHDNAAPPPPSRPEPAAVSVPEHTDTSAVPAPPPRPEAAPIVPAPPPAPRRYGPAANEYIEPPPASR
jgi:hypothetical protein